ncbi:MAG: FAD-binding domain-containing protein [Pseudomonadota bacterium]
MSERDATGALFGDQPEAAALSWAPTRAAGLQRMDAFASRMGRAYAGKRNYDYGPERRSNISALSPWVRYRLILETEVLRAALARHAPSVCDKFVQEVFWRAYFKGWMEQRPLCWRRHQSQLRTHLQTLRADANLKRRVEQAEEGRTGIECFDAWAQELVEIGYLHNHTRMWFASIWIFTLQLPWDLGADFFYRHLLDGDPASNTLSWRWVAGLHTKGKTYLARPSNIERYTDGRFTPTGLAEAADPLIETEEMERMPLPAADPWPEPGAGATMGLLITGEDCAPEIDWAPADFAPSAIAAISAIAGRSPRPIGKAAARFDKAALEDAAARATSAFDAPTVQLQPKAAAGEDGADWLDAWTDAALSWAQETGLTHIVTPYAPVGPAADAIAHARPRLAEAGVGLSVVRRRYDAAAWPHAKAGFFGLKKKIPQILADVGLAEG